MKTCPPALLAAGFVSTLLTACDTTVETREPASGRGPASTTITTGNGWAPDDTTSRPTERVGFESVAPVIGR